VQDNLSITTKHKESRMGSVDRSHEPASRSQVSLKKAIADMQGQDEPWKDYRGTLEWLEEISLQRWEDLTRQARWSFRISMGMSLGLFLVGTTIVIWGLLLLTRSDDLSQQITGGVLSGLAALVTTYSSKFWKDPVEHIQRFAAQQACVQAVFIGYMNRVAQLRLVFAHHYEKGKIKPDRLESHQRMLSDAVAQAVQRLGENRGAGVPRDDLEAYQTLLNDAVTQVLQQLAEHKGAADSPTDQASGT
jgi:hypothetical protein